MLIRETPEELVVQPSLTPQKLEFIRSPSASSSAPSGNLPFLAGLIVLRGGVVEWVYRTVVLIP
jgi:hypothetical protein